MTNLTRGGPPHRVAEPAHGPTEAKEAFDDAGAGRARTDQGPRRVAMAPLALLFVVAIALLVFFLLIYSARRRG